MKCGVGASMCALVDSGIRSLAPRKVAASANCAGRAPSTWRIRRRPKSHDVLGTRPPRFDGERSTPGGLVEHSRAATAQLQAAPSQGRRGHGRAPRPRGARAG